MTASRGILILVLSAAGCGGGGPSADSPLMMTCDIRNNAGAAAHGECQEWRGDVAAETNKDVNFDTLCTSTLSGAVNNGTCPEGSVVGECLETPSVAERVVIHFYYPPDFDASSAEAACNSEGGAFTAK